MAVWGTLRLRVFAHQQRHKTKRLSPLEDSFHSRADYLLLNSRSL